MIELIIYILSIVGGVKSLFTIAGGVLFAVMLALGMVAFIMDASIDFDKAKMSDIYGIAVSTANEEKFVKTIRTHFIKIFRPSVFLLLIGIAIPSQKTIAAMYLIPKIIENKEVNKIPDNLLKLLNLNMEKWINDLSEEVVDEHILKKDDK